jgi:probable HAF family extracellular repeat protein
MGTFSVTLKTAGSQIITAADTLDASITGVSNTISVGPAKGTTHFSVTVPESAAASTAFSITVTALDASNITVTGYSGSVHFTSTDGQAVLPGNSTFANGTGTFSATLKTIGNQSIMATDTVTASITGTSNSIKVMKAGTFLITSAPLPNGTVGQAYGGVHQVSNNGCLLNFTGWPPTAAGGTGAYHWSWSAAPGSSLPPGLAISGATNTCSFNGTSLPVQVSALFIGGTPTTAGAYNVIVTVTDSASPPAQASAPYQIRISGSTSAAAAIKEVSASQHHHYKLIDVGTLGGPNFFANFTGYPNRLLNDRGTLIGGADTSETDPFCFNVTDCFVMHAFRWQDGALTDLGTLPGGANSQAFWVNERGLIAGMSQNGAVDPLLGIQALKAVVWEDGNIIDLGMLEGGYESAAQSINNRGQVTGIALNTIPDPAAFLGTTQNRAFLWQAGDMQDLGTLGGPDALGEFINEHGQVAGISFTDSVVNSATGVPTTHPFLWEGGKMTDLGTLGGTYSRPYGLNNRGQVVGASSLKGDVGCNGVSVDTCDTHPFLWENGTLMDLGTLGGSTGGALAMNDSGEIVGAANNQNDQAQLAFVWKKGVMTSLGALEGDDCSEAKAINSRSQIVGTSYSCAVGVPSENATLWENGSAISLNSFVPLGSNLHLTGDDMYINDRGEIAGTAVLPSGEIHAFLLIPCDEQHPNVEGCDYSLLEESTNTTTPAVVAQPAPTAQPQQKMTPSEIQDRIRAMMTRNRWFVLRPQQ